MSAHSADPGIDSGACLPALAERARATGQLALDTEFMGEGRYRTLLCLVQLAVPWTEADGGEPPTGGAGRIELIDPLASELDAAPLAAALADPQLEIVVHAGRQDIALLRRRFATSVSNVFDTQVAAGFAGMPAQSSYESLLAEILGVRLAKSASFTRWDARPLSAEQLKYAREDVVHLLALAAELRARLRASDRLEWARQECETLEQASDERDLDTIFSRLPRIRGLNAPSQAIARELVQWREQTASSQDRPVQGVLGDATLVEVAKRKPASIRQLEEIRGVGQGTMRRRGTELLEAIARGRERTIDPLERLPRPVLADSSDAPLVALAEALVRARTREADLAYELVASRADLQAIVACWRAGENEADTRTLRGWRRELVGAELLELLDGGRSLSVAAGELRISKS